jgi:phosphoserine aminotransferase
MLTKREKGDRSKTNQELEFSPREIQGSLLEEMTKQPILRLIGRHQIKEKIQTLEKI